MRCFLSVYLIVSFYGNISTLCAQEFHFKQIIPGKDENTNTVLKILQDRQGFIWFGTKMGLIRYDGYQFTYFKYNPNKPDWISGDFIRDFAEDRHGDFWIAIENGGLNHYQKQANRFITYYHRPDDSAGLPTNYVMAVYPDSDGTVWLGTKKGLYHFDPIRNHCQAIELIGLNVRPHIVCIIRDRNGWFWLATRAHGLIAFNPLNGASEIYRHQPQNPSSLVSDNVWTVYEDHRGELWIGTLTHGLSKFNRETKSFVHYQHDPRDPQSISSNQIICIYEDTQGRFWIGTYDRGLNLLDRQKNTFRRISSDPKNSHALSSDNILSIFEDRTQSLWFGTYAAGVNVLFRSWKKIELQSTIQTMSGKNSSFTTNEMIELTDRTILVGTSLGLAVYDSQSRRLIPFPTDGYRNPEIARYATYSLFETADQTVWLGTELGLARLNRKGKIFELFQYSEFSSQGIETIFQLPDQRLLLSYYDHHALLFDPDKKTFHVLKSEKSQLNQLHGIRILSGYAEGDTLLWIGTNRSGLYRYHTLNDALINFSVKPFDTMGISNNVILSLNRGNDGKLWIGTEGGLNCYDPMSGKFTIFREEDGLTDGIVYAVWPERRGVYWIITSISVARFDPGIQTFRHYDETDGFPSGRFSFKSSLCLPDGSILIGHEKGFVRFHPDEINDNPYPPPVVLTGFRKFNREVQFDQNITFLREIPLSYRDLLIAFDFAALSYAYPEKNKFAYRLDGFDENWNFAGNDRTAIYTNLSPGEYLFRVKASNHDGIWNEEGLAVRLIISPPFWKTWWAYTIYVIGGIVLIYGGMQWRSRSIRRRNKELAQKIEERTKELQKTQVQLIQASKMASLGEMVAGLSHEINNPVTFITGNIENIRIDLKNMLNAEVCESMKTNLLEIDQALQSSLYGARRIRDIVQNMKNFCKHDEAEFKEIRLHKEIDTILDLFFNQIKDIQFIRLYDHRLNQMTLSCYAAQINQCFRNILINAVQAIREAEKKKVLTPGHGRVEIRTNLSDHQVQIQFCDNGIGIPENIIDKIFDPFFTTREVGAGKGLGLTEAYGIIQKHGGQILVTSEYLKRTEVTLLLPYPSPEPNMSEGMKNEGLR